MPRRPATKRPPEEGKKDENDDKNDVVKSLQRKSRAIEASFQNAFDVLKESVQKLAQKYERAFKEEEDEEEEEGALKRARTTRDEA